MAEADEHVMKLSECTVCLQAYSYVECVPRVLACGHSLCEACVSTLATLGLSYGSLLRCPECTHLTRLSESGPSGLPKNIELLRSLHGGRTLHRSEHETDKIIPPPHPIPQLSKWVLPYTTITCLHEEICTGDVVLFHNSTCRRTFPASLLPLELISFAKIPKGMKHLSYTERLLYLLQFVSEKVIRELLMLLNVASLCRRVSPIFGLWMSLKGTLYLVFRKHDNSPCELWQGLKNANWKGADESEFSFKYSQTSIKLALEFCELFMELHSEGFAVALMQPDCFILDRFGHVVLDLEAVGRGRKDVQKFLRIVNSEINSPSMDSQLSEILLWQYASPELLSKICGSDGCIDPHLLYKADIWMLGCLLFVLFCGRTPWSNLSFQDYFQRFVKSRQKPVVWLEEQTSLTTLDCESLKSAPKDFGRLLLNCFAYELESRPTFMQIWHMLNTLTFMPDDDEKGCTLCEKIMEPAIAEPFLKDMMQATCIEDSHAVYWCIALGIPSDELQIYCIEEAGFSNSDMIQMSSEIQENNSISTDTTGEHCLDGHLDSVTALIICGEYILSASFDKSICVWSLEVSVACLYDY